MLISFFFISETFEGFDFCWTSEETEAHRAATPMVNERFKETQWPVMHRGP